LAAAIVAAAKDRGLPTKEPSGVASVTGQGVTGKVGSLLISAWN